MSQLLPDPATEPDLSYDTELGAAHGVPATIGFGSPFLGGFAVAIAFVAGAILFGSSGEFRGDVFNPQLIAWTPQVGGGAVDPLSASIKSGKKLYLNNCALCHQSSGVGAAGQYPSLVGSEWANGSPSRLAALILNGLAGRWEQNGTIYNGNMQPWKANFDDKQIADIMTYIRQEWGNKGGPVSADVVAASRKLYGGRQAQWSQADISALPQDDIAPGATNAAPGSVTNAAPAASASASN